HQEGFDPAKKTLASHAHFPTNGPYDSSDPAVIDRHLDTTKSAGIDTLVCSWWGQSDPTDKAIRAVLLRAQKKAEVTACIYWERLARVRDRELALSDLSYILGTVAQSPAYLRVDGKPVVFLYERVCQSLTPGDWAWVLNEANKKFP